MHEDFVLLNVDMSSAFSVVASGGASAQHPKHTNFKVDNGVLRLGIDLVGPNYP
jgi:hypothetical protein